MKLYKFDADDHCSIVKSEDVDIITGLKTLGYCETPQEAKEKRVELINDRITNITQNYQREIADLSTKINFIKNF